MSNYCLTPYYTTDTSRCFMPKLHNFGEKINPSGTLQAAGLEGRHTWPQQRMALIALPLKLAWKMACSSSGR